MSVEAMEVDDLVFPVRPVPGWAQPIMSYMIYGSLPSDETKAKRVQRRFKAHIIINMDLYKRSVTTVLQRCVEPEEGKICSWRSTKENVVTMLLQEHWLQRCSDMDFTGPLLYSRQKI